MKKIITSKNAPAPIGPYNQAILSQNTLYISGQIAINSKTNELVLDSIRDEVTQVMANLKAILAEVNMSFDHIVKCSIFISDMDNFSEINALYATYFDEKTAPARETVEVAKLPKNVTVEISAIAVL